MRDMAAVVKKDLGDMQIEQWAAQDGDPPEAAFHIVTKGRHESVCDFALKRYQSTWAVAHVRPPEGINNAHYVGIARAFCDDVNAERQTVD